MPNSNHLLDPRGKRGVYSRGKPMYPGGRTGPVTRGTKRKKAKFDYQTAAKERLADARRNR